jgi:hypothetical protein
MKIKITLKDPDGVSNAIMDAVKEQLAAISGLDERERDELADGRTEQIGEKLGRWITYGEYVSIEFDLDTMTATVLERGR